jgi:hypothetical protein
MYIFIDSTAGVSLREPGDFTTLKLVSELSLSAAAAALETAAAGSLADPKYAWISQQWLRARVLAEDAGRVQQFDHMIAYATNKGWIDPRSAAVRVHIESCAGT